jgi:hypothetical protein
MVVLSALCVRILPRHVRVAVLADFAGIEFRVWQARAVNPGWVGRFAG